MLGILFLVIVGMLILTIGALWSNIGISLAGAGAMVLAVVVLDLTKSKEAT